MLQGLQVQLKQIHLLNEPRFRMVNGDAAVNLVPYPLTLCTASAPAVANLAKGM